MKDATGSKCRELRKLRADLGPLTLNALEDPLTAGLTPKGDGRPLRQERLGEPMREIGSLSLGQAHAAIIFRPVFWPPRDWGLSAGIRVGMPGAVKEGLPPVIKSLLTWRKRNRLSRRGALEVMKERGLTVSMHTLTAWEQGTRSPGSYSTQLLVAFLRQHPRIENPPYYPPGPPPGFRDRR